MQLNLRNRPVLKSIWNDIEKKNIVITALLLLSTILDLSVNLTWSHILSYYMASAVSGQDESNHALWLATRAGKMELSCPFGTTRRVPQENVPESHIINPLLSKLVRPRWLDIGLVLSLRIYGPRHTQKKNLPNIQPSWPHTCSITHTNVLYVLKLYIFLEYTRAEDYL